MKIIARCLLFLILIILSFGAWKILGPTVKAPAEKYFYITAGSSLATVKKNLVEKKILSSTIIFDLVAERLHYQKIKPGRYRIRDRMSMLKLVRMLRNGEQFPVTLVITKFRTKEDFTRLIAKQFEIDASTMLQFLNDKKNFALYGLNPENIVTVILPNSYQLYWNAPPQTIFTKLLKQSDLFWNEERKQKAAALNLSAAEVYILASIIDEESNYSPEKATIASVYLNRIKKRMPLQADPTIKFALKDFSLKRIYKHHLSVPSPYNTYIHTGLPPGPICTAQPNTIDAVLNAPKTDYLYFVADENFSGTHVFSATYEAHQKKARAYQKALTKLENKNL